jgi:uncharacterized protein
LHSLIVADTGPLLALARIEQLGLLSALFQQVLLTPTVLAECEARPDRGEGRAIRDALATGCFEVQAPRDSLPVLGIGPGETSALALALERGAGVLMDDKAGRAVARRLGVAVIGSVGVLVLAKRKGLLPRVRPLLEALVDGGYFLAADIVKEALRLAGE